MATYAIGDLQGCLTPLKELLHKIKFSPDRDRLWFTGDLINRGPQSLEALRFVKSMDDNIVTVLGNHDLHLLAVANGDKRYHHREDTLNEILEAPDHDALIEWIRHRPFEYHDNKLPYVLIHAGLPPQWDMQKTEACARELESVLQGDRYTDYLDNMYGNEPDLWNDKLQGWDRLRFITNCFTRMRYCNEHGQLLLDVKDKPGNQPQEYQPWFRIKNRKSADMKIIFGHWSTLGHCDDKNIYAIDSGCLWGGKLTALRLDTEQPERISVPCQEFIKPF